MKKWSPTDRDDLLDVELLDPESGNWDAIEFCDLRPGDIYRASHAGRLVHPITLEPADDELVVAVIDGMPFRNLDTARGWQVMVRTYGPLAEVMREITN